MKNLYLCNKVTKFSYPYNIIHVIFGLNIHDVHVYKAHKR